jgi:hypothetical protein
VAFAGVDRHAHVSRFVDMHDVGDMPSAPDSPTLSADGR